MKKQFIYILLLIVFITGYTLIGNCQQKNYIGRWAEKISERVVMDIYSNKNDKEYKVFITWRENNLAQKDIYRFMAKSDDNGNLRYENGIHIYRFYKDKNRFADKIDYTDGSGVFKTDNNEIVWIDSKDNTETRFIRANKDLTKSTTLKNKLFSIILPEELKGFYEAEVKKNRICIYDKASKKAGFGGFIFGIKAYENPEDHAALPGGKKLGELIYKGKLYDVVLKYPTDVQYDYTKSSKAPESYKLLYDLGNFINIIGAKGATYYKNQGTEGKYLYKDILKKHITAIKEKWDSEKLENENMSYMYNVLANDKTNILDKIGYTFYDVNADGIEELLIGEIALGDWKGVIYDIYTMVNREPKHVISGGSRNRYYVCDDAFICNEYSSGAMESGVRVYNLVENSTELYSQVGFKYDGYTNPQNPWFLSYGSFGDENNWENVTEGKFRERKQVFERYKRFDYIPLSKIK